MQYLKKGKRIYCIFYCVECAVKTQYLKHLPQLTQSAASISWRFRVLFVDKLIKVKPITNPKNAPMIPE